MQCAGPVHAAAHSKANVLQPPAACLCCTQAALSAPMHTGMLTYRLDLDGGWGVAGPHGLCSFHRSCLTSARSCSGPVMDFGCPGCCAPWAAWRGLDSGGSLLVRRLCLRCYLWLHCLRAGLRRAACLRRRGLWGCRGKLVWLLGVCHC